MLCSSRCPRSTDRPKRPHWADPAKDTPRRQHITGLPEAGWCRARNGQRAERVSARPSMDGVGPNQLRPSSGGHVGGCPYAGAVRTRADPKADPAARATHPEPGPVARRRRLALSWPTGTDRCQAERQQIRTPRPGSSGTGPEPRMGRPAPGREPRMAEARTAVPVAAAMAVADQAAAAASAGSRHRSETERNAPDRAQPRLAAGLPSGSQPAAPHQRPDRHQVPHGTGGRTPPAQRWARWWACCYGCASSPRTAAASELARRF